MGAKLGGRGVSLPLRRSPTQPQPSALSHAARSPVCPSYKTRADVSRSLRRVVGAACVGRSPRGAPPAQLGRARPGISQHHRQLPRVETPCALWFWKVTFLAPGRAGVSVLKTRTTESTGSCFLPTLPGAAPAPSAPELPGCFGSQTRGIFRPGRNISSSFGAGGGAVLK